MKVGARRHLARASTVYYSFEDTPHKSWIECHDGPFLSHARMSWFYKYFLPLPITSEVLRNPTISPLLAENFKGLPPTLVYPAEIDVLREEGLAYAKRLKEEGDGWVECVLAEGVPHPFVHQVGNPPFTSVSEFISPLGLHRLPQPQGLGSSLRRVRLG